MLMVLTVFKEKIGYLVSYLEGHRRSIGAAEPEAWDQRVFNGRESERAAT